MPLDNVRVEIDHRQVTIWWSDCSNIQEERKGYKTTFECVSQWDGSVERQTNSGTQRYIPAKPNRRLELEFKNDSGCSTSLT